MTDGAIVAICGVGIAAINGLVTVLTTRNTNQKVKEIKTKVEEVHTDVREAKEARLSRSVPVFGVEVAREPEVHRLFPELP